MAEAVRSDEEIRELVRERYAAAARRVTAPEPGAEEGCCGSEAGCCGTALADEEREVFGAALYAGGEAAEVPEAAALASLGCGNPTAVAELNEGETVLDLGSGGGLDVLLSARRVGPSGRAYGLDMTEEMLELARHNAAAAGAGNVEFLKGEMEAIPLPDASVDVVISNCVINLAADKRRVLAEAARVLRPGGRFAVTDVIADPGMDEATRSDMRAFTGCVAGALTDDEFRALLADVGLAEIEIRETHRVHRHAASAIVRARKPPAES
jgi:SAM-dependent methyltransferase